MSGVSILPKGTNFARMALALARASKGDGLHAIKIAEAAWGVSSIPALALRSAVSAGATTGDYAPLAEYAVAAADFVDALRPATLLGKISGFRRVPLEVKIPRATAGSTIAWVGQSGPAPVSAMAMDMVTLAERKMSGIVASSSELARHSTPAAEGLVRADLIAATVALSDRSFIDPSQAGETGVAPASITNGAASIAATGTNAAAARADLRSLFHLVLDAGIDLKAPHIVMTRRQAANFALMSTGADFLAGVTVAGGIIGGVPLVTTSAVPSNGNSPPDGAPIVLLDAAEILLGDENGATIDASAHATIEMESSPSSPPTESTVRVSMWQQGLTAWRVTRAINWQVARDGAVAYISNANYAE